MNITSRSHDLPVLEPTITYLLCIVEFVQVKRYDEKQRRRALSRPRAYDLCLAKVVTHCLFNQKIIKRLTKNRDKNKNKG